MVEQITNFFILCSGADRKILEQCPTEKPKYAGIGATIFFTAVLATISGGYAMHFVFENAYISIPFGILWGIIIFNLDRYIVLSIKKAAKKEEFKNELWTAFPRFVIAIFLAISISKPLELRLFNSRIEKELGSIKRASVAECENEFNKKIDEQNGRLKSLEDGKGNEKQKVYSSNEIYNDLKNEIPKNEKAIEDLNTEYKTNKKEIPQYYYADENDLVPKKKVVSKDADGKPLYEIEYVPLIKLKPEGKRLVERNKEIEQELETQKKILGDQKAKKDTIEKSFVKEIAAIDAKYEELKKPPLSEIDRLNKEKPAFIYDCQTRAEKSNDLLQRLEALGNLSKWFNPVWWASMIITILIMLLECAPIIVKLLSKRGPYDDKLEEIEYKHYIDSKKSISDMNDEINNLIKEIQELNKLKGETRVKSEKAKLDAELKANTELLNDIAKRQAELAQIAIDKWYQEEKDKLKNNPNYHYAKENTSTTNPKPVSVEEKLWRLTGHQDQIYYYFKNGTPSPSELIYIEKGESKIGKWEFLNNKTMLKIDLDNAIRTYDIVSLTDGGMKLRYTGTNDHLEFIH